MKRNRRCNTLAIFLCIAMLFSSSMFVQAETVAGGSDGTLPPAGLTDIQPTVSSGDMLMPTSLTDTQLTVSSGDMLLAPNLTNTQPTVSSGDVLMQKDMQVNAWIQNISNADGSTDPNGFEMVLEAWLTGETQTVETQTVETQTAETITDEKIIDETAVLRNELSAYFDYYCHCDGDVHTCVKAEIYTASWDGSQFGEPVAADTSLISVAVNGKAIEITGFDYDECVVVADDAEGNGQKLIVKIRIEPETGFWGGNNVPVGTSAVYCNDQTEGIFPVMYANVPLALGISAKDKTIYHGGDVTAAELLLGVTAGYETVGTESGAVTVKEDGTFAPLQDWMDDYAVISWNTYAGKTPEELSYNLSNAVVSRIGDGLYPYIVKMVPVSEAAGAVGEAVSVDGITASSDARVYVLVPKVVLRNTEIYGGYIPDNNYFSTYNLVSAEWVEMNGYVQEAGADEDPTTYPAADPALAPQLTFEFEPGNKTFSATSVVKIYVKSTNDDAYNGISVMDQSVFYNTTGDRITNEFTIIVNYYDAPFEMPATGGNGTAAFGYGGLALLIAAALLALKNKRGQWCKRTGAAVLALAVVFLGVALSKVYAAVGIQTDAECVIQIDLRNNGFQELTGEDALPVQVRLYKVADVDIAGNYTALSEYEEVDLSVIDADTTTKEWSDMAVAVKEVIERDEISETATGVTSYGEAVIVNLETGLYLLDVPQVMSDEYIYDFTPFMIALPNNHYYTDGDDSWIYDLVGENAISLKVERTGRLGNLTINKLLDTYNESLGEATFVFQVEAVKTDIDAEEDDPDKTKLVFSDVFAMTFDGTGTDSYTIEGLPAGADVTVTEIYSGASYTATTEAQQTVQIVADDTFSVNFENTYDGRLNAGSGIVNSFLYDSESDQWIPVQTKDSTP